IAFLIARHRAGITVSLDITAIDYSNEFLEMAKELIQIFRHHFKINGKDIFHKADLKQEGSLTFVSVTGSAKLVMASNILSELSAMFINVFPDRLNQLLNPDDFLLLMEPAQRFPARKLLEVRDRLCKFGWKPIYPCPGNYMCPVLERRRDWCHHRLKWEPPELVKMIDGLTGMNKHLLNFTPLIMRKTADNDEVRTDSANWYRVISEVRQLKGKLEVVICGEFSNKEHQKICMLENKYFSRYNELFPDLARYDQIRLDKAENRANRLILSETSRLTKEVDDGDRG
ncbi:small ribosomal subunit Rsm22 family protein, partial [bacterium]|nr:small ribosomal subunit Rsm22 family protein [bacterium]